MSGSAVLLALLPAQAAWAHPILVATVPTAGYGVAASPARVGLTFDEPVDVAVDGLVVADHAGQVVPTSPPSASADGQTISTVPVGPLPTDTYTVRWRVTADDGDVVEGTFGFGVGSSAAPDVASTATVGLPAATVLRWLLFTGLALALGGLVGERLVLRRSARAVADSPGPAPRPWVSSGCLLGATAALGLAVHHVGGGDLVAGLRGFSIPALLRSGAGALLVLEFAGFVAAAVAWRAGTRGPVWLGLGVVLIGEGARNHLHALSGGWGIVLVIAHLGAAALWVGALVHVARVARHGRTVPGYAGGLLRDYATLAAWLYGVVLVTGTLAAITLVPSVDALIGTSYGRVLVGKVGLVVLVSVLAVLGRRGLRSGWAPDRAAGSPPRSVRWERSALVLVLGAAALLTSVSPPARSVAAAALPPTSTGPVLRLGTLAGQVTTAVGIEQGRVVVRLGVPGSDDGDEVPDQAFTADGDVTDPSGDRTRLELISCGTGCFTAPAWWQPGTSALRLTVGATAWRGGQVSFAVPWPLADGGDSLPRAVQALAATPVVTVTETVTSDPTGPAQPASTFTLSGAEFVDAQPYRAGTADGVITLGRRPDGVEIAFGLGAENVYVRLVVGADGLPVREEETTPNHLITRTFSYP